MLIKTVTLGCKVNQYETEYVRQGLARLGWREAGDGETADLCIVNTCTVTADGDAKSRKAIRHLHRLYPQAEIVVMGCYATRAADEVAALPGVTDVVTDKRQLPDLLARFGLLDVPSGISTFGSRHRAYVKVQDGCPMQCSYCIIPLVRPALWSRPPEEVLDEIRRLVEHGHREIVLTGIHLGHYGAGLSGASIDLAGLLRRIVEMPVSMPRVGRSFTASRVERSYTAPEMDAVGLRPTATQEARGFRVRLSSMEAVEVTPELLAVMRDHGDRVCPHMHLSMQSGSDAVLERMRRRWPTAEFLRRCDEVRRALGNPGLTTDVIVGFPGETDAEFAETCRAVERAGFSKLHIFRFSPRQGTAAADLPCRVPGRVQQQRAAELAAIGERLRQTYFESLVGRRLQVLVESSLQGQPGRLIGTSGEYAPVELPGGEELIGRLVEVTAGRVADGRIIAGNGDASGGE